MKALLNSRLAAIAGTAAAAVIGWFVGADLVAADQAASATAELALLIQGVFASLVALLVFLVGLILKKFTGGNSGGGSGGSSGGGLPVILLMAAAVTVVGLLPSCVPLSVTNDGCVLGSYTDDGRTWKAGPCVGPDGKVDRLRVQWSNEAGQELRATIYQDHRRTLIEYHAGGGLWLQWTAKSGVVIGPLPPQVETAVENETPLPAVEAAK